MVVGTFFQKGSEPGAAKLGVPGTFDTKKVLILSDPTFIRKEVEKKIKTKIATSVIPAKKYLVVRRICWLTRGQILVHI